LVLLLEIIRSELLVGLIESPENNIQLDIRSTSSWKVVESYLVQRDRYSKYHLHRRPRGEVEFSQGIDVNDEQQRT